MDSRARAFLQKLGQAEVAHLHLEIFGEQDVFRFNVAVQNVAVVDVIDGVGALTNDANEIGDGNACAALSLMFLPVLQEALIR